MKRRCRPSLLLLIASAMQGCVSVHAPLERDDRYPPEWGSPSALGRECKSLEGTYSDHGTVTAPHETTLPISLTSVLNIPHAAKAVALSLQTRRTDQNGDAFVTLRIALDGDASSPHEIAGCFCIRQTLACTQVSEKYWTFPNFGLGGAQRNIYFSIAPDRSLIAKLQNYHADVILGIPVFGIKEPWARFQAVERGGDPLR